MHEKLIWRYGCVKCQEYHYEGERLYAEHHHRQDKHGCNQVPASYSLVGKLPVEFDKSGRLKWTEAQ